MNVISLTKLYELLSEKLDKETAENLINFIEYKINHELESKTTGFATKEELAKLESRLIKWVFIFWISQIATIFGLILLYIKK